MHLEGSRHWKEESERRRWWVTVRNKPVSPEEPSKASGLACRRCHGRERWGCRMKTRRRVEGNITTDRALSHPMWLKTSPDPALTRGFTSWKLNQRAPILRTAGLMEGGNEIHS